MPLFLRDRDTETTEIMDGDDCDPELLKNTYRHFSIINRYLSGWDRIFHRYIVPHCSSTHDTYTLLDIGFGGGDIAFRLHELAKKYGIRLEITAIDTDPRALAFVEQKYASTPIRFRCSSEKALLEQGLRFDFVVSNHLLHHLSGNEISSLLENCNKLTGKMLIFNDLRRSDFSWILFNALTAFSFRNSYIRPDGLTSIRRSYTPGELQPLLPKSFYAGSMSPFRLLITQKRSTTDG